MNSPFLSIVFQDRAIVVVNKPGGLLSVPGRGPDKTDCVESRVRKLFPNCIVQPAVHRLDMDTSGLIVLALTSAAHGLLSKQFQDRFVEKNYVALLDGVVEADEGEIQLPCRVDIQNRPHQIYDPVHGKLGITRWKKIAVENGRTRIAFFPLTGRTHQLRIHAAHTRGLGCPILGDRLYGNGRPGDALHLHAARLCFRHPHTGDRLCFESAPPF